MPRGHRRSLPQQRAVAASRDRSGSDADGGAADRGERTVIFSKTKMCKFHILGMCSKGSGCRFAHHKDELNPLPDLSRTKLCKTLIATGMCEDPQCRYAHNREQLRALPEGVSLFGDMPEGRLLRAAHARAAGGGSGGGGGAAQRRDEPWSPSPGGPPHAGPRASPAPLQEPSDAQDARAATPPHPVFLEEALSPHGFLEPRIVVKNTFLDVETARPAATGWIRSSTWATGLCGPDEEETSPPATWLGVPDYQPGSGWSREVSATSDASTAATAEGRRQDMSQEEAPSATGSSEPEPEGGTAGLEPPPAASMRQMFGASEASFGLLEGTRPPPLERMAPPWPCLQELPVKNTFLQFDDDLRELAPLRAVRTAAGRLDLMA